MLNTLTKCAAVAALALCVAAGDAKAWDLGDDALGIAGSWQVRLRGIGVLPDGGGFTTIGGQPKPEFSAVPELDVTYFFTDHVSAELILATSPHNVKLKNMPAGAADLDLGSTWVIPPTLLLQYHFTPESAFDPYIGVGVNYTMNVAENNGASTTALEVNNSFGYAFQAGADYWLDENWGINIDVKKIFVDVHASVNNGAITGEVALDPWVVGAGISYRF